MYHDDLSAEPLRDKKLASPFLGGNCGATAMPPWEKHPGERPLHMVVGGACSFSVKHRIRP
jgi:hypothetical protein